MADTTFCNEFAQLQDDWESASRYLPIFIDESEQTIDELTEALLALEAGGGRQGVEQLFIAAHRLKGSAASIGLNRAAKLAHLMEDLLQILREDERPMAPPIADGLLACTDGLRRYVDALKAGRPEADQFDTLARQLLDARSGGDDALADTAVPTHKATGLVAEQERVAPTETTSDGGRDRGGITAALRQRVIAGLSEDDLDKVLVGRIDFEPNLPIVGLKARLVYSKLSNLGNVCYFDPPAEGIEDCEEIETVCFGVATDLPPEAVERLLQVSGIVQIAVEPLECRQASPSAIAANRGPGTEHSAKPAETLRVDIGRLDGLMHLAGQLTIGTARAAQIGERIKEAMAGGKAARILDDVATELKSLSQRTTSSADAGALRAELDAICQTASRLHSQLEAVQRETESFARTRTCINDLFETIHMLDGAGDGIRQSVMDMRMLPIGPLFSRFHRVIRDITRANGKEIHLAISGEKTELDKRMIDELGDPMIHLIRNAADHGIESPAEREAIGKPRQSTISLDACHRGSSIVIRVSDDGQGLDADRIRAKAIQQGLLSAADAEAMTREQIYQLIWLPGLSTAEKVTDVSGRGIGMDIVRTKIKELSGRVEVSSEPGRGTTFTIKLPLTLAVLPSLMVEIDGDVFALPLESVLEIVRVGREDMATVHGQWTAPVRDRVVGVLAIGSFFRWHSHAEESAADSAGPVTLVLMGEKDRQLGLAVDRVLGEENVVIKSIADNYRNIMGIAGATILGDGRIALILDPATLIDRSSNPVVTTTNREETLR
jgi:two-component system, chemotaxis family, sensor kinase CheA